MSENKFKIGDRVKVVRKFESTKHCTWNGEGGMDRTIGKVGRIADFYATSGTYGVEIDEPGRGWYYYPSSLELVTEEAPAPLTIEAGKFYKTRKGLKARIYATDGFVGGADSTERIHGAIDECGDWRIWSWRANGISFTRGESEFDIVAEWTEPHPAESWPVDAKIMVRDNVFQPWVKRHFEKFVNGLVYAWAEGYTSFTTDVSRAWSEAKLAEE